MKLVYRGYQFQNDSIRFGTNRRINYSPLNQRISYTNEMLVRGDVRGVGSSAITTLCGELEDAVSVDNGDLKFLDNFGNETIHGISSSNTLNGVQVSRGVQYPISPPEGSKTELFNKKTFEILFSWEEEAPQSEIVAWDQNIKVSGGGPDFTIKQSFTGAPQIQTVSSFTDYVAVQQGRAIGWSAYPSFPPLHYSSGTLVGRLSYQQAYTPMRYNRNGNRMYPIEWRYYFWSPSALLISSPSTPLI